MRIKKHRGGYRLDFRDALNVRQRLQFATHSEAEEYARQHAPTRAQRRRVRDLVDPRVTVATWGAHWLAQVTPALEARSAVSYRDSFERFIKPRLGTVPLRHPRFRSLARAMLGDCLARGSVTGGPLAPNSVRLIYAALRSMCQLALDEEVLAVNPVQALGGRRGLRLQPTSRQRRQRIEARVLAPETLDRLLEFVRGDKDERGWLALLCTYAWAGLRLGEAVALEVDDFDPVAQDGGTLHVQRQLDQRTGKRFGPPKNGPRVVELRPAPRLGQILTRQMAELRAQAAAVGTPVRWLFPSENWTTPIQPRNVERAVSRIARKAGLPRLSPHDLRHTYGTLLVNAGASPLYVQRQLGHASIQLTVDTYCATAQPRLPAALVGALDGGLPVPRSTPAVSESPAIPGTPAPRPARGRTGGHRRASVVAGSPADPMASHTPVDAPAGPSGHIVGTRRG